MASVIRALAESLGGVAVARPEWVGYEAQKPRLANAVFAVLDEVAGVGWKGDSIGVRKQAQEADKWLRSDEAKHLVDAELWRMPNPDGGEAFTCILCRNSTPEPDGSYKLYSLWVHPELRPLLSDGRFGEPQELTAHNALASTYGERGETYAPAVET